MEKRKRENIKSFWKKQKKYGLQTRDETMKIKNQAEEIIKNLKENVEKYSLHLIMGGVICAFMVIITGSIWVPIITLLVALSGLGFFYMRRAYKEYQAKMEARRKKRKMIMDELVTTERTYVGRMEDLNKYYFEPLCLSGIVSLDQIKTIFGSFQVILGYNKILLSDFEKWGNGSSNMEEIFSGFTIKAHFLKCYIDYTNNFDHSTDMIIKFRAENPKFVNFLSKQHQECGQPLESLLIMPIQRIPRYILLLKELIKNAGSRDSDLPTLEKAYKAVSEIATKINSCKKAAEDGERILNLQNTLVGLSQDLISPGRVLVKEGNLTLYEQKSASNGDPQKEAKNEGEENEATPEDKDDVEKVIEDNDSGEYLEGEKVNVYLFSDLLVVASGSKVCYELKLLNTVIRRMNDAPEFIKVASSKKRIKLWSDDKEDIDEWFNVLIDAKKTCDERRRSLRMPKRFGI